MEQEIDYEQAWNNLKNMLFYQTDLAKHDLCDNEEVAKVLDYVLSRMLNLQDVHTKF